MSDLTTEFESAFADAGYEATVQQNRKTVRVELFEEISRDDAQAVLDGVLDEDEYVGLDTSVESGADGTRRAVVKFRMR